jgi:ATP-binding cassette subfamily F protein 3
MRLALTLALQDFEGALVIVSHDRHLLRTVADDLWLIADGKALPFDDDLEGYRQWVLSREKAEKEANAVTTISASSQNKKQDRQAAAAQRQKLQPLRNAVKKAEQHMDKLNQQLAELEKNLADNALYAAENKDQLKTLLQQQSEIKTALEEQELAWFEATEALETAQT